MRSLLVPLAVLVGTSPLAAAPMSCDRDLLFDMAREVLITRADLPGLAAGNVGGEAAYVLLRSDQITQAEAAELLSAGRAYRQADDLFQAYAIAQGDRTDLRSAVSDGNHHAERAVLLIDAGQTYFDIVADILSDPAQAQAFKNHWFGGTRLPSLLTDQSPEVIATIAARAEADGHYAAAAGLYALLPDDSYIAFWQRIKNTDAPLVGLADPVMVLGNGTYALSHDAPVFDPDDVLTFQARLNKARWFYTMRAALAEAGTATLAIILNQTGREAEIATAGQLFLDAIARGDIDPSRRPEEGWAFLLSALSTELGTEQTRLTFASIDITADDRHYAGRVLSVFEMATAAETAGPWVRGETDQMPAKPAVLTDEFDWQNAMFLWGGLRDGATVPAFDVADPLYDWAIEGYIQMGQIEAAMDYATAIDGARGRVDVAEDIMARQNRLCDQYGILPGASLMQGGRLIFDFSIE